MTHDPSFNGPHQGQPVLQAGSPLDSAKAALVLIHGRGATARGMLELANVLSYPEWAYLAPQAADNTWYPQRFIAPLASNEPELSSALAAIEAVLDNITRAGIKPEQTVLLGFSQGACLALEFVARRAQRYGAVAGLSGGLIGPEGTPREYAGSLAGTPIFLGCSDVDSHIPKERVIDSADVLQRLGGDITLRLYPQMGHTINEDELEFVRAMMAALTSAP